MKKNAYSIIIIGAGPAGLMAAIQAYPAKKKIIILEKMHKPAIKLKITGKGRCNITNNAELPEFIKHFGKNGRFLKYSFSEFFSKDLLNFFERRGVQFKLERGERFFPKSDKAMEIAEVLIKQINKMNIQIYTSAEVSSIKKQNDDKFFVSARSPKNRQQFTFISDKILIAAGGKSYPQTGSTGGGYMLADKLGHTITPLSPSLVPIETEDDTAKKLQGLSLKNVCAEVWSENKKIADEFGEMLFTDFGVSGPIILTLSKTIVKLLNNHQPVTITIDLKPALDHKKLDQRILREINEHPKQGYKSLLKSLLPQKLIQVFIDQTQIAAEKRLSELNAAERKKLRLLLKEFKLEASGFRSYDQAIVTKGGVNIKEINPQTMESKLVKGLYFAGEVIDINADTGGFNLQAAFSTGWTAGQAMQKTEQ